MYKEREGEVKKGEQAQREKKEGRKEWTVQERKEGLAWVWLGSEWVTDYEHGHTKVTVRTITVTKGFLTSVGKKSIVFVNAV